MPLDPVVELVERDGRTFTLRRLAEQNGLSPAGPSLPLAPPGPVGGSLERSAGLLASLLGLTVQTTITRSGDAKKPRDRRPAADEEVMSLYPVPPMRPMTPMEEWLLAKAAETVARLARETGMSLDEALALVVQRLRTARA